MTTTYGAFSADPVVGYGEAHADWRLPTLDEFLATGPEVFDVVDISPEPGLQTFDPEWTNLAIWTATSAGKKRGIPAAYVYFPNTGDYDTLTQPSTLNAVVVRGTFNRGSGSDGGGGGKGKKK